ncbi:uncharacterized protein LOC106151545 [Lingula anatina]|uniref:Uncharacterized protein LOC106151545 n=1 Tax=Lingula anatina TaxID=7574 RepID=A0A1S3H2Z8_LINAN|nr:uncharacterized protein LOC106151545 [Lingula anatina]|eukprot:XP_013380322.2 uncharacterized protein LOC106151545 [Lingula anatina]
MTPTRWRREYYVIPVRQRTVRLTDTYFGDLFCTGNRRQTLVTIMVACNNNGGEMKVFHKSQMFEMGVMQLVIISMCLVSIVYVVNGTDSYKVMKTKLGAGEGCIDIDGNPRTHLEYWNTTDTCDKIICWNGRLANFTITQQCHSFDAGENPDSTNCFEVADMAQPFPSCCPSLVCNATDFVAPTVATCGDLATAYSCDLWKNHFSACVLSSATFSELFNYTQQFCQQTCGLC